MPLKSRGESFCGWKLYSCWPVAFRSKSDAAAEGMRFKVSPHIISEQQYKSTCVLYMYCTYTQCLTVCVYTFTYFSSTSVKLLKWFTAMWVFARKCMYYQIFLLAFSLAITHEYTSVLHRVYRSACQSVKCVCEFEFPSPLFDIGSDALHSLLWLLRTTSPFILLWIPLWSLLHVLISLYLQLNVTESHFPVYYRYYHWF